MFRDHQEPGLPWSLCHSILSTRLSPKSFAHDSSGLLEVKLKSFFSREEQREVEQVSRNIYLSSELYFKEAVKSVLICILTLPLLL